MWNKQVKGMGNGMGNGMGKMKVCLMVLIALFILVLVPVVSAEEQMTKITYISYTPNEALEMASETNDYSDLIEYTYIPGYDASYCANETLLAAAESGFLETQDVIVLHGFYDGIFSDPIINDTQHSCDG